MTRNVKSLAYMNLLGPNIKKGERNTGKFVNDDQLILNLARDELKKNKSTSKPAVLHRHFNAFIKSIGSILLHAERNQEHVGLFQELW